MQFTFPTQEIRNVSSLEEARRFISLGLELENLQTYCSYKFQLVRAMYIYCRCRDCPAKLVFRKDENKYVLFRSYTLHKHRKIRTQKVIVMEAIKNYPECFNSATVKEMIMNRFKISTSTFYRYFREAKTFGIMVQDVLATLRSEGFLSICIKSQTEPSDLPQILLVTCESMINCYHADGKNVKFDLTYNLIREQTSQSRQYAVGVFTSLSNNMNINPLCLVIMSNQTKESFLRVFNEFFTLFRAPPNIIITDEQKTMAFALEELKQRSIFTGHHFIDLFHVLRNSKKNLYYRPSINQLVALSRSTNSIQYQKKERICYEQFGNRDRQLLETFTQKMSRCCIGLLPPIFIGMSCSTNSCEKLNDLIKTKIPYSQKYTTVLSLLPKFLLNLITRKRALKIQKIRMEDYLVFKEISELRQRLCKNIFQKLVRELSLSLTCLINLTDDPHRFTIKEDDFQQHEEFQVIFDSQEAKWTCQCRFSDKIGIPCAHILKVVILMKQKFISAINPWWLLEEQSPFKRELKIRFPRKTRRQ